MPVCSSHVITSIKDLVLQKAGFDISSYDSAFVKRRIEERLSKSGYASCEEYAGKLGSQPGELDALIEALSVPVSSFFRDNLIFELLAQKILPAMMERKRQRNDHVFRIWSAGCAGGEEAYSLAVVMNEYLEKSREDMSVQIFGNDRDPGAVARAVKGIYTRADVESVKYGHLTRYFTRKGELFHLREEVKKSVYFSVYDLTDQGSFTLPDSIFGDFDLLFCRNVLMYLSPGQQQAVIGKFWKTLVEDGYLGLGEYESPGAQMGTCFAQYCPCAPLYRKRQGGRGQHP